MRLKKYFFNKLYHKMVDKIMSMSSHRNCKNYFQYPNSLCINDHDDMIEIMLSKMRKSMAK